MEKERNIAIYEQGKSHIYAMTIPISNAINPTFKVSANYLGEAVDNLADYIKANDMRLFYEQPKTEEELAELLEDGYSFVGNNSILRNVSNICVQELPAEPLTEGNFMYGTIEEISNVLAEKIYVNDENAAFQNISFASDVIDVDCRNSLADEILNATGWYGINHIDLGFDSTDLDLVSDYYGGGCATIRQFWDGMEKDAIKDCLLHLFIDPIEENEGSCRAYDVIFVELKKQQKKYIVCIDDCYIRDMQIYNPSSDADMTDENYEMDENNWSDGGENVFLGIYEASSEEVACKLAAKDTSNNIGILFARAI